MQNFLYGIFNSLSYTAFVGMEIYLAFLLVAFLIAVFISGFKCDYNLKKRAWFFIYSVGITLIFAGLGTFIYLLAGVLPMFNGGNFLEYGKLPFGPQTAENIEHLHTIGITMIEIGVTLCVMFVIISILDVVLERTDFDD